MSRFSNLSKQVGWEGQTQNEFPTLAEVQTAVATRNDVQILRWYRFLRSAHTGEEAAINDYVCQAYNTVRIDLERNDLPDTARIPLAREAR